MHKLSDYEEKIHSCSKCGLCQSVCPIYKITGNDCTVSRGHFIMLRGLIKGELKMSKTINKYLDLCLKCGACSKFCPSGIDVVDIVALAKAEYFKNSISEKLKSLFHRKITLGLILNAISIIRNMFSRRLKSKNFDRKVIYFGGCEGKSFGSNNVIKILNALKYEVITPDFDCCGLPFFVRGDMAGFAEYMDKFFKTLSEYDSYDIVTTCASCEKMLKSYEKWGSEHKITVKNIYDLLKEESANIELKKPVTVTFHKPCNLSNPEIAEEVLQNITDLNYQPMKDYDKCCGFNGIGRLSEYKTMTKLFAEKHKNILNSGAKIVLTSCQGCEFTLKLFSFGRYKVYDFTKFLAKNIKNN